MTDNKLTHFDASGNAVMVDVSEKTVTFGDTSPKGRGIADVPKVSNAQIRSWASGTRRSQGRDRPRPDGQYPRR